LNRISARRVIYIVQYPLGFRDAERFGLAELQKAGLQVEVWDVSHFAHPSASELGIETPSWVNATVCSNIDHLSDLCSTLTTEHVVILIDGLQKVQARRGRKLLRLLSATPARLGLFASGQTPNSIPTDRPTSRIGDGFRRVFGFVTQPRRWRNIPRRFISFIFFQSIAVRRRMGLGSSLRPLDHIWASTVVSNISPIFITAATKVTYIHSLDYDQVLAVRDSAGESDPRVVFIDSMGPLHPDYFLFHGDSLLSTESYSAIICKGLAEIEDRLGTEVVVAAHPRALSGLMEPWYGGRTVIYGKTAELIANATAVIVSSGSTAIGTAVVFQRPLLLLNSKRFDFFVQVRSRAAAQELDQQLIDLDAPELPPFTLDVNTDAYARYVQKYIKQQGTPEEPFWSVVASEIVSGAKPPNRKSGP
jgi:hypothetical protein